MKKFKFISFMFKLNMPIYLFEAITTNSTMITILVTIIVLILLVLSIYIDYSTGQANYYYKLLNDLRFYGKTIEADNLYNSLSGLKKFIIKEMSK